MSNVDKVVDLLSSFNELQRTRTKLEGELRKSQIEREQLGNIFE